MGGVTNGELFAFGGVEVQPPIYGLSGANVQGPLENIMAVTGGDELDVMCIEEAVC